ncbi:hypothetical protein [Lacihabitans lacunae]|uniref:Uncharacterized protein n=1 Tax=Lacihabitans lacunae TaxID=1028214 RepID=A0ABV7YX50_9BACT
MIKCKLIANILDLLLDGDNDGLTLRNQINFLTDTRYNYTGAGVFVTFSHSDQISKYKLERHELVINGVDIKDEAGNIDADAQVFVKNGLIDYLEIWSRTGDYPDKELDNYTLTQVWDKSPSRQIKKANA